MGKTLASDYFADPKINQALESLEQCLKTHQDKITGIKPPQKELEASYEQALQSLGQDRGAATYYPYLGSGFGKGPFVELEDGSIKYDFIIGIGVHQFGHSHPGIMKAMVKGALTNTAIQGHLQQNSDQAYFIKTVLKHANKNGAGLDHCFLTTTGVMAAENALKMVFQKRYPKNRVLAFKKCFMGRTIAVSQITDKPAYRDGLPDTLRVDYLPFYDQNNHEKSIQNTVDTLKAHIARYPQKHAAICMELIQGEAGSWPGHKEFFKAIIEICKQEGISVIVDEVQTFGRTSELFAFQYFELDQDIDMVTIGKNSQVCATLYRKDHQPRAGLISQTFTASCSSLAAGQYIIDHLVSDGYLGKNGKIEKLHQHFKSCMEALHEKHPEKIEGPYGIGAMCAMSVFQGDPKKSQEFTKKLFHNGVIGFVAGAAPTRVRFLLPVGAIETTHIDEVAKIIDQTLGEIE